MAFQRLGRRLEDGIKAYIEAYKSTMLSGVDIITPKQADACDAPWLAVYSGSSVPFGDSDRRGEIRGPMRTTLRVTIAEHMSGDSLDQYCGEFVDIISRSLRLGTVLSNTAASAVFRLNHSGLATPTIAASDLLRIGANEHTVASVATVSGTQIDVTLTATTTLTALTPVFMESESKRVTFDYAELISYLNANTNTTVWRVAFISETPSVEGDLRTHDYEFEIDAVNTPNL